MRIGAMDTMPGKASAIQENGVKALPMGSANAAKELSKNEETRNEWQVSESFIKKAVDRLLRPWFSRTVILSSESMKKQMR